ncbi:VirB4 family type IV secretion system protein [Halocatena halophila]|uniref:VirB4 family type IV secretion system protein n=1 Tax=Halocatena halophila TaxID=2814576 RepID=UPI002ED6C0DA
MTDNQDAVDAQLSTDETPAQVILPETDAGMRINGIPVDRITPLIPGAGAIIGGSYIASHGLTSIGGAIAGVGALSAGVGAYLTRTTPAYTTSFGRIRGWLSMRLRAGSLPLDRSGAASLHGVEQILGDGSIEMVDGRVVRFARLNGRNTDFQTDGETQTMVNTLRRSIDGSQRLSEIDFSIYSMAVSPDPAAITEKYRDVWLSERWGRETNGDILGYLRTIIEGEPDDSESWKATEWEQYLVVQVGPDDIETPDANRISGETIRQQQQIEAERRLKALREAFSAVPGVTAQPVSGTEHARVVARHWAGTRSPNDFSTVTDGGVTMATDLEQSPQESDREEDLPPLDPSMSDRLIARVNAVLDRMGSTFSRNNASGPSPDERHVERLKELISAARWDERPGDDMVVAGDQFCRTFWIADWPVRARALFLKELHTMRGIDLSIHHRFQSRDSEAVKEELKTDAGSIDASIVERKDGNNPLDADVLADEMDAYVAFFKLLHHTDVQPWEVSTYVTVRAGTRTAMERAESLIDRGYDADEVSLDLAKRRALEDACDDVEEVLSGAGMTPITDANRQRDLFQSGAPTGRDRYASPARKRICGTGAVAATFPPASTTIDHEDGVELGRNPTNGRAISIDPFATPPAHRLTLGMSGSGKTWTTLKQVARWYLSDPDDRTLVFVDNEGDFAGVTELLNGSTITIGGRTTLNPLRMESLDPEAAAQDRLDPFRTKQRFVTGLILDLICETDDARDRLRPLIRDGVESSMVDAGLDPDDPSTHTPENSPTLSDVYDAVEEIGQNPSLHVRSQLEEEEIEANVGALLRKLGGFSEDGVFGFLTGPSDATVSPGGVTYLDLQQIEGMGETDHRTTMLSVALGEVYEAVKTAPGETLFVIDEAHHLLKSPRILSWLEESSRHWRHNDAGLWFVSQHPGDFATAEDADEAQHKNVIRDQTQTTELFHTTDRDALADFGLNEPQIEFVAEKASKAGDEGVNHAGCLVDHPDAEGWLEAWVTLSAGEHSIFSYDPDEHGSYGRYIDANWSKQDPMAADGGEH